MKINHSEWVDTAVLAAVHALPRSLDGVTAALKLKHKKDKEGHRLMLNWSKPKKPSKVDPSTRYSKNFERLVEYCEHDIYAEVETFLTLPEQIPAERDLWLFDQEINFRGFKVDRPLVTKIQALIKEEKGYLTKRLIKLTKGKVTTAGQRAKVLEWCKSKKCDLPNMQAKTVQDAIADLKNTPEIVRTVLKICTSLNKTSLKKYPAFLNHSNFDSYVRFSLQFSNTVHGRWTGQGLQPHNIPRGTLKYKLKCINDDLNEYEEERDLAPFAADLIASGADLAFLRSQFGDVIEVLVSCLRCMIICEDDEELYVSDFSAIEARVLFWLAGHEDGCKAFEEKRKMYEELAMVIFKRTSISQVTKDERFVGKQSFLLSGYGGGWKKFMLTCEQFGNPITAKTAKISIDGYRTLHKPVTELWKNLEQAAISAVENPSKTYKINMTEWFMDGKFLCCRLPSQRVLFYYAPEVKYKRTPWGATRATLYHYTVDSKTRQWGLTATWGGVLTQNCVGGISRDLLASSMLRVQKAGYPVRLTVHDEIISTRKKNTGGTIEEFNKLMAEIPKWAKGCPVATEGFKTRRYHK